MGVQVAPKRHSGTYTGIRTGTGTGTRAGIGAGVGKQGYVMVLRFSAEPGMQATWAEDGDRMG